MSAPDPIKVYDARWEVHEFDDVAVGRLFEAALIYGRDLGVDTVTLSRDARLDAGRVLEIAIEAAARMGMRMIACPHPISTPASYFLTLRTSRRYPGTMGFTITASHNPANYIGVKFTVPTVRAIGVDCGPDGGLTRVREIYHSDERAPRAASGRLELEDPTADYIAFSMEQARVAAGQLAGLRVVIDGLHGAAGPEMMMALQRAGVEVVPLHIIPDGQFRTGSPNPTVRGRLDHATRIAADHDCHAVIGLDGDGDRIVFGDRRGVLSAGFAAIPILRACAERDAVSEPETVLHDPKVNPLALTEWSQWGLRPMLHRNGHSQIKEQMRRVNALAAVEESGHYYHRITVGESTVTCESSVLTSLLLLDALHREPGTLDELWSRQQRLHTTGEFNYEFPNDVLRDEALDDLVGRFRADGAECLTQAPDGTDLEGTVVRAGVQFEDGDMRLKPGWYSGYIRVSTTERGIVRCYFSADDVDHIVQVERTARGILGEQFPGQPID